MHKHRFTLVLVIVLAALVVPDLAASKEITSTVCGEDRCRTVSGGVSGIAVLPTRVQAPNRGRFYTVAVRIPAGGTVMRWRLVYDARRHLVLARNAATRSILGSDWRLLAPGVRRAYSLAVRGLEPMRTPPR